MTRIEQGANEQTLLQALVSIYGSAASYNDKGAEWSGHSSARLVEVQRRYQAEQVALAARSARLALVQALVCDQQRRARS